MKNLNKEDKQGVIFVVGFLLTLAAIAFIAYNYQNQNIINTLKIIGFFSLAIIVLELIISLRENEGDYLGNYRHLVVITVLVLKGLFIVYSFVLISLSLILTIFLFFTEYGEKKTFNIIFSLTFFIALIFYRIYQKVEVSRKLNRLYEKIIWNEKKVSPILNSSPYKKDVVNVFDFLSIFLTVLLLTNSTFSAFSPALFSSEEEFWNSFEIKFLLTTMPIYVISAYYRLPIKQTP